MGIFGNSASPLEAEIEKATSDTNITEKWSLIMDVCDKIGSNPINAKESLRIIIKRLNHADPHVVMQAITLLDACINNCGKNYHLEVASREFEQEFKKLVSKSQPAVANKLKQCLKKWAEGDFKADPQLNLIPSLYSKMKSEGHDFVDHSTPAKRELEKSSDPNVVSSQQEEDDIAKAIELSLKEKFTPSKAASNITANASSLYPSMSTMSSNSSASASATKAPEPRKVRAIYDFEAAEDNELTFKAGEIIMVIEESDPNWWRGSNHRGEGYFPANFVTADLSAEPEDLMQKETTRKSNKIASNANNNEEPKIERPIEINEEAIDRLLFLLHEADPEDPSQDTDEMMRLENFVNQMGPLIDSELERVDRRHAQLTQLSSDLIDTINLYHSLMRDTEKIPMMNTFSSMQNQMYRANSSYRMPGNMVDPHLMGQMGIPEQMNQSFPSHLVHPGNMAGPMSQINNQIASMSPNQEQMIQQYQNPINGVQTMPNAIYQNSQDMQNHHSLPPTFPQNHNLAQNYYQQMNRIAPQNFQMNPNMIPLNQPLQNQQQITDMLGNMTLQAPQSLYQQQP
ncbi:signal transducing adapter molecule 1 [Chironomus tepperi]|uniref:signal transducing adapter molecule 1 n=1 Tax=Chironomus tepperi TaxID=113505 RepID=UPI00391FA13B